MNHEYAFLEEILKNDSDAVEFVTLLGKVSQIWDDLIDGGVVTPQHVNFAFYSAVSTIPSHPFYTKHQAVLAPLIELSILDWMTANVLEMGSNHDKSLAFVLRDSLVGVVVMCARIVGGIEWAQTTAPLIRRYFHDEPYSVYAEKLPCL